MESQPDIDPQETQEWLDALDSVIFNAGGERAHFLLEKLIEKARRSGAYLPYSATTAYLNTIPTGKEERSPGNNAIEHRIRSYVRWNAMAMVLRANRDTNVGGHIASFASAATLYDVGYNSFLACALRNPWWRFGLCARAFFTWRLLICLSFWRA
jgi:pyruvate dehydrogenase E1 component